MIWETFLNGILLIGFTLICILWFSDSFKDKRLGYRLLTLLYFLFLILFIGETYQTFSQTIPNKLFGLAIAQFTYSLVPLVPFCFALKFIGKEEYIKPKYLIIVTFIPIIEAICGFINCFDPILFTITMLPTGFIALNFTPLFNLFDTYALIWATVTLVMVFVQIVRDKNNRRTLILFIVASLPPMIVGYLPVGREMLPIGYFLALVIYRWSLRGSTFLDADFINQKFLDYAELGMLAFDKEGLLVEFNPFAKEVLNLTEDDIKKRGKDLFNNYPNVIEFFYSEENTFTFLSNKNHWFKINQTPIIKNNEIIGNLLVFEDITNEHLSNQELLTLNEVLEDIQGAAHLAVFYLDNEGKWYYPDEAYKIIEREPREGDEYRTIFADLMDKEYVEKRNKILELEKPGEVHNEDDEIWPITLENGKVKYLKGMTHLINDDEGNFVRKSYFIQDITDEYLHDEELRVLRSTTEDIQTATHAAIYYYDKNYKFYWPPEVYNILEREPREDDEYNDIIFDLVEDDIKEHIYSLTNDLGLNEFLGEQIFEITLESGKKKMLKGDIHQIPDNKGNLLRTSCYVQDITEEYLKNHELLSLNAVMKDVQEAASLGIYYQDANNKWHYSDELYSIIDREPRPEDEDINVFTGLMDDEDFKTVKKIVHSLKPNEIIDNPHYWHIVTETGNEKYVMGNARRIFDDKGNFIRTSVFAQDVTDRINYENKLIQADKDKTILVKEVHHRVKNNLQLINSFIRLEKRFHEDEPDLILDVTEKRLGSLALIHERIYNEENMSLIHIKQFLEDMDNNLFTMYSDDITHVQEVDEDIKLSVDVVTPLSLIINELTINTFKYAFPEGFTGEKIITKSMHRFIKEDVEYCEFKYSDSGIGLPDDFDVSRANSLGWTIIISLIGQLDGEFEVFNDNGFNIVIKFPLDYTTSFLEG